MASLVLHLLYIVPHPISQRCWRGVLKSQFKQLPLHLLVDNQHNRMTFQHCRSLSCILQSYHDLWSMIYLKKTLLIFCGRESFFSAFFTISFSSLTELCECTEWESSSERKIIFNLTRWYTKKQERSTARKYFRLNSFSSINRKFLLVAKLYKHFTRHN